MFDIMALAYQGDLTRVINMMCANEGSGQTYPWVGINEAFHPLSHHQENPEKMTRLSKIQTYHSTVVAKFLDKLKAMPDGEKSVLDNSIILYGSNMSNSNQHNHYPLPTAVIGGGRGTIKGDQHIRMPEHTPLANLLHTMLDRSGVKSNFKSCKLPSASISLVSTAKPLTISSTGTFFVSPMLDRSTCQYGLSAKLRRRMSSRGLSSSRAAARTVTPRAWSFFAAQKLARPRSPGSPTPRLSILKSTRVIPTPANRPER